MNQVQFSASQPKRFSAAAKGSSAAARRSGAAFLLLVVALLLVVLGATQALLRGEIASQRNRRQQLQADTLQRAIVSLRDAGVDWQFPVELPIDDHQRIVIAVDKQKTQVTAHWMSGQSIQNTVVRDFVQTTLSRPDETDRPSDPEI
jgi:type II secretory pathway pseudopilin PulG